MRAMVGEGGLMTSHRAQILKERLITAITADGLLKIQSVCWPYLPGLH